MSERNDTIHLGTIGPASFRAKKWAHLVAFKLHCVNRAEGMTTPLRFVCDVCHGEHTSTVEPDAESPSTEWRVAHDEIDGLGWVRLPLPYTDLWASCCPTCSKAVAWLLHHFKRGEEQRGADWFDSDDEVGKFEGEGER